MKNIKSGDSAQIFVKMFGGFEVNIEGASITDTTMRTHQLWHLIEYLIAFRHKTISQDELIEVLWAEGNIDNPSNALKNLVYRIRSVFSSMGMAHAKEMIVFNQGSYRWNNSLNTTVDTERFEDFHRNASDESRPVGSRIENYLAAIDVYTGDFLPGSCYENWVIPIANYYRSMYFKCVYDVLEILNSEGQYDKIEEICEKALTIDKFEENVHIYLMTAMLRQGKQTLALAHYSYVTDLFFRELGLNPSSTMTAVYRELVKSVHDTSMDIISIQEDLIEAERIGGAFYCEYMVFKNIYRLEARTAARSGQSIFICLMSVERDPPGEALDLRTLSAAMDELFELIQTSLRQGDVFSRFSTTQYVLMLPAITYENCDLVVGRILKKYRQVYKSKGVSVTVKTQPLNPVDIIS